MAESTAREVQEVVMPDGSILRVGDEFPIEGVDSITMHCNGYTRQIISTTSYTIFLKKENKDTNTYIYVDTATGISTEHDSVASLGQQNEKAGQEVAEYLLPNHTLITHLYSQITSEQEEMVDRFHETPDNIVVMSSVLTFMMEDPGVTNDYLMSVPNLYYDIANKVLYFRKKYPNIENFKNKIADEWLESFDKKHFTLFKKKRKRTAKNQRARLLKKQRKEKFERELQEEAQLLAKEEEYIEDQGNQSGEDIQFKRPFPPSARRFFHYWKRYSANQSGGSQSRESYAALQKKRQTEWQEKRSPKRRRISQSSSAGGAAQAVAVPKRAPRVNPDYKYLIGPPKKLEKFIIGHEGWVFSRYAEGSHKEFIHTRSGKKTCVPNNIHASIVQSVLNSIFEAEQWMKHNSGGRSSADT
tara:strand:+ start:1231 stop:2472 length:1242 start_codon:yes stop_codon:yes gene_type:complete